MRTNSEIDGAKCTEQGVATTHTVGFTIQPQESFGEWLYSSAVRRESTHYRNGGERTKFWVPECGLIIGDLSPGDLVPRYKLSTEAPAEVFLEAEKLYYPTAIYRLDVAIDYPMDLSGCWFQARGLKARNSYVSSGKLETLYLGGSRSQKRFRIYDRAGRGAKSKGNGWRIELEWKPKTDYCELPQDLFDGLDVRYFPPAGTLPIRDAADLEYLYRNPEAIRKYPYRTRKRLDALREEHLRAVDPSPAAAYRAACTSIQRDIIRVLRYPRVTPPPAIAPIAN